MIYNDSVNPCLRPLSKFSLGFHYLQACGYLKNLYNTRVPLVFKRFSLLEYNPITRELLVFKRKPSLEIQTITQGNSLKINKFIVRKLHGQLCHKINQSHDLFLTYITWPTVSQRFYKIWVQPINNYIRPLSHNSVTSF